VQDDPPDTLTVSTHLWRADRPLSPSCDLCRFGEGLDEEGLLQVLESEVAGGVRGQRQGP